MTVIATCAFRPTYDVAKSLEMHLAYIDEAAEAGADLVVFPETSLQGYPEDVRAFDSARVMEHLYEVAEPVPDGPSVAAIAAKAAERGVHVIYGLTEAGAGRGILYNTMVLTGPEGFVGRYRKVHLAVNEQAYWRPGHDWPVYDTPIGRIGMLICYDKAWPESCRELTLRGADLLVMSTAWGILPGHGEAGDNVWLRQYELFDRVRAAENGRWFVSSNFVGELGGIDYFGLSQIVDPLGEVVATTGTSDAGLAIATVDLVAGLAAARVANLGAFLIRDRRPETYRALRGELPIEIDG